MNLGVNGDKLTKQWSFRIVLLCLVLAVVPPVVHWVAVAYQWHRSVATAVFSYDPIYQVNAEQNLRAAKALFRGDSRLSVTQADDDQTLFAVQAHFWSPRDAAEYIAATLEAVGDRIKANNLRRTFRAEEDARIAGADTGNELPVAMGGVKPSYMGKFRVISFSPVPPGPANFDYESIASTAMLSSMLAFLLGSILWGRPRPALPPVILHPQIPRAPFFLP